MRVILLLKRLLDHLVYFYTKHCSLLAPSVAFTTIQVLHWLQNDSHPFSLEISKESLEISPHASLVMLTTVTFLKLFVICVTDNSRIYLA